MDPAGNDFYQWLVVIVLIITSSFFVCSSILYPPRRPSVQLSDVFVANTEYPGGCRLVDVLATNYHVKVDGDPALFEFPYQPIRRKGIKFIATKSLAEVKRSHFSTIFFAVIHVSAALAFGCRGWKLYNIGNDNYPRMMLLAGAFLVYGACFVSMDWLVRQNRSRGNRTGSATIFFNANERTWIRLTDSVIRLKGKMSLPVKWISGFMRMVIAATGSLVSVLGFSVATWGAVMGEGEGELVARVLSAVVCTIAAIISSLATFKCCNRAMKALTTAVTNVEIEFGSEVHAKEAGESIIHVDGVLKAFVGEILDPITDVRMSCNGTSYDFAIITVDGGVFFGRMRPSRTRT
ncbi:hypothetical protein V1525DRAFT_406255 [Lipomyces kononenkoae]|uniref:Uncharacterized protein n=1 Tax=Lipomyces kononenkoae TaxID=34357 RepID=A0ACC3SYF9_LIPKO